MEEGDRRGPPKPTAARRAIAVNLQFLREHYRHGFLTGLTPEQLSEGLQAALSAKTIRRLENQFDDSSPNLDTIDILADFFGVKAWELIQPQDKETIVSGKERQTPQQPLHSIAAKKKKSAKS